MTSVMGYRLLTGTMKESQAGHRVGIADADGLGRQHPPIEVAPGLSARPAGGADCETGARALLRDPRCIAEELDEVDDQSAINSGHDGGAEHLSEVRARPRPPASTERL